MNNQPFMPDKEMLDDVLTTQKVITSSYNLFANECASKKLRDDMMCLLHEEHDIQADIFTEMQTRGWYSTPVAEQQKIDSTKTKFSNINMSL